ncbi:hypothetical protein PC128_g7362 [Phytophthora cactorum]|nr:hypothetical protein PC120_g20548 [Phytophthora cactorum]KAG3057771.1 hypothetical protein PC121_g14696 [Phytophthora cactorum]KAG3196801.1 hypothetical protein PC128_g7362 [Phytophthora cactorum]KAG4043964.1 hypothetical protein PC123_g20581 [Phytophthora cactorum]
MRTHPMFYMGLLKSYQGPAQVSVETLARGRRVRLDDSKWRSHRTRSVQLKAQQQIELTLQLSNLTLEVDDPVLKSTRCLEPVHSTVHLFEIFCQAGV